MTPLNQKVGLPKEPLGDSSSRSGDTLGAGALSLPGVAADGGPAFPYVTASEAVREVTTHEGEHGMSLRDYFAAKALPIARGDYPGGHQDGRDGIARVAYQWADAMLKARAA